MVWFFLFVYLFVFLISHLQLSAWPVLPAREVSLVFNANIWVSYLSTLYEQKHSTKQRPFFKYSSNQCSFQLSHT